MSRVPTARSATGQHRQGSGRGGGSRARRRAARGGSGAPGGGPVSRADGTGGIDRTGGTEGNERLTAMTGAVLLALFAAEGVTIAVRAPPADAAFLRRDAGDRAGAAEDLVDRLPVRALLRRRIPYVRKGPPAPLLRLLGPVVVLTSCGVIGSGIMLAFAGPGPGPWLFLHKALFVLWFGAMTIHVLAYAPRLARLACTSPRRPSARYRGRTAATAATRARRAAATRRPRYAPWHAGCCSPPRSASD